MKKALYAGSFDPITKGHIDIINRSLKIFDHLYILVASSSVKNYLFSLEDRVDMIRHEINENNKLTIITSDQLTVNIAESLGVNVLIRGIRTIKDYEYELTLASANKFLKPNIETLFLLASSEYSYFSSSLVKEMASYGQSVKGLVGEYTLKKLEEKY